MQLQPGTRIGGYDVVAPLGAGGMGEVYRARDTRLGREVAIKILSPDIAGNPDSVARFEREARALASLNHPNIAAIYDVLDSEGQPALVLELVEGETLADRLMLGAFSIDQALACARQLADALDTAHEVGIVHRDLKPSNITISESGQIKVLDFGLAKAIAAAVGDAPDADLANSPTITVHGTRHGVILGTAAYMSPEQARGKRIDKRTDIWAFGCVLFEMLTAQRAFAGETTSDVIAAVLERGPDLSKLPASTPLHLRSVIQRCLEKDPKRRARDIGDVRAELDAAAVAVPSSPAVSQRTRWLTAAAAVITAAAGITAGWWLSRPPAAAAPIEFTFGAPPGHTFATAPPAVSPDGRYVAFVARDDRQSTAVWIRSLSERSARRIDATAGTSAAPRWSPDSRSLLFLVGGTWKRTNIDGGPALTVLSDVVASLGASWNSNDEILLATANRTSLSRVPVSGGSVQQVTTLDPNKENSHRWPMWLPDNHHFLFTVRSDRPENIGIKLGSLDSAEIRPLVNMPSPGVYAKPGYLLFMTPDEVLMAQRLDPSTWTLQGAAQPIAAPVSYSGPSFAGLFDASFDGRVVAYLPASRVPSSLTWFDRTGKSTGRITAEQFYRGAVRVSPDGRTIAVELADERYGTRDLWLIDASTQALTRLTTNPATDWRPVFAPDGATIAFASDRAGASTIFRVPTTGGSETVVYRAANNGGAFPYDWSRDGKYLLATIDDQRGRADQVVMIPVDGSPAITLIDSELGRPSAPRFSPDGTHVAFVSDANGTREIYVMSIRDRRRVRVSTEGGFRPLWGGDGRELFFQNMRNEVMRAVLASDGSGVAVKPELLFVPCTSVQSLYVAGPAELAHDVTADGTRFLFNCQSSDDTPSEITVLVNWQSRLR